jgi:hypothetical protein
LLALPSWRDAAAVAAAVDAWAERGEGAVTVGEHASAYRLTVGRYVVRFTLERDVMRVWRVLRTR